MKKITLILLALLLLAVCAAAEEIEIGDTGLFIDIPEDLTADKVTQEDLEEGLTAYYFNDTYTRITIPPATRSSKPASPGSTAWMPPIIPTAKILKAKTTLVFPTFSKQEATLRSSPLWSVRRISLLPTKRSTDL